MGADGGIAWVDLQPGAWDRFSSLVSPLGFDFLDDGHPENLEEIDRHRKQGRVFSTYGTGQDVQGYSDLEAVLQDIESRKDTLRGVTFQDAIEDVLTTPPHWSPDVSPLANAIMHLHCGPLNAELRWMDLIAWAAEIRRLIIPGSFCEIETWT